MKKFIALLLLALFVGLFVFVSQNMPQAHAQQSIANVTQKQAIVQTAQMPTKATWSYHVPPITCQFPTSCQSAYFGNGALEGYWALKIRNCSTCIWVRTSRVNGADWNNDYVAPISCPAEDSCSPAHYYNAYTRVGYAMLFGYGKYIRTSMLESDGAVFQ